LRDRFSPFNELAVELSLFATRWQQVETYSNGHYVTLQPELEGDLGEIHRNMAVVLGDVQRSVKNVRTVDFRALHRAHRGAFFVTQDPETILKEREGRLRGLYEDPHLVRQRQLLTYCSTVLNALVQVVKYFYRYFICRPV
jgi:hypothetical protein